MTALGDDCTARSGRNAQKRQHVRKQSWLVDKEGEGEKRWAA
jgi:hypothetical protein